MEKRNKSKGEETLKISRKRKRLDARMKFSSKTVLQRRMKLEMNVELKTNDGIDASEQIEIVQINTRIPLETWKNYVNDDGKLNQAEKEILWVRYGSLEVTAGVTKEGSSDDTTNVGSSKCSPSKSIMFVLYEMEDNVCKYRVPQKKRKKTKRNADIVTKQNINVTGEKSTIVNVGDVIVLKDSFNKKKKCLEFGPPMKIVSIGEDNNVTGYQNGFMRTFSMKKNKEIREFKKVNVESKNVNEKSGSI